jgi:hypothetical protein
VRFSVSLVVLALVALAGFRQTESGRSSSFNGFNLVDEKGNIRKPSNYRDGYRTLGVWAILDPKGDQMHYTYASPGAVENYRKTGKFLDGTVLVKEVRAADHAKMTTGDARWAAGTQVWFVLIKDEKGRYPGNPLWGDGWGWALFKSDAPDKQVATNHTTDCLGCHIPAKATDWIYIQGYPVLSTK